MEWSVIARDHGAARREREGELKDLVHGSRPIFDRGGHITPNHSIGLT